MGELGSRAAELFFSKETRLAADKPVKAVRALAVEAELGRLSLETERRARGDEVVKEEEEPGTAAVTLVSGKPAITEIGLGTEALRLGGTPLRDT
jgi:hypothetical protein